MVPLLGLSVDERLSVPELAAAHAPSEFLWRGSYPGLWAPPDTAPSRARRPWEDWFTESFAAVLDQYPKLGAAYAGHLIGRDVDTAAIETQRTFDNARPDMWVDARDAVGGRHVVMVEHKKGEPAIGPSKASRPTAAPRAGVGAGGR